MNRIASSLALVITLALAVEVRGQCQYSVQEWDPALCQLGSPEQYFGTGLNNAGGWCGWRHACFSEQSSTGFRAIYCPPGGTPQVLPMPPGTGPWGAQATAVNDAGVVVGYFSPSASSTIPMVGCVWWPDRTVTVIPPLPGGTYSRANAINNKNVVACVGDGMPFLWQAGVSVVVPVPDGTPRALSEAGHVVGSFPVAGGTRGFRFHDNELTILYPLAGYSEASALDVANNGTVIGYSQQYLGTGLGYASMATVWFEDEALALELPLGHKRSGARAINDSNIVVGEARTSYTGGSISQVVWIDWVPHLVQGLLASGSSAVAELRKVNEGGEILSRDAKLLTPIGQSIGDLNGDCVVDGADLVLLLTEWGPREGSVADTNADGTVDGADLAVVLGDWSGSD